jgi:hypothetical protein
MQALIDVFRMNEISVETRIRIIKQLGEAINADMSMNITEPLVYELVLALDPSDEISSDPHYKRMMQTRS